MLKENLIFRTIDPDESERIIRIETLEHHPDYVKISFNKESVWLDSQQLSELGGLLLAIAGTEADFSSHSELLDGYSLENWNLRKQGLEAAAYLCEELA